MFYSVNCADDASRTSLRRVSAARRNVRPEIAAALSEDARLRICDGWGAAQPGPRAATPVVSDVPTLILAGEYAPLTPPRYARIAGRTLRNSDRFQFPAMGHNLPALLALRPPDGDGIPCESHADTRCQLHRRDAASRVGYPSRAALAILAARLPL